MTLRELIQSYDQVERHLCQLIADDDDQSIIARIDKRLLESFEAVASFPIQNEDDLRTKIAFLARQLRASTDCNAEILDLLLNTVSESLSKAAKSAETPETKFHCPYQSLGAADLVARTKGRLSIIDATYRYVTTSAKNGNFYKKQPTEIAGQHVANVIGKKRFVQRAKPFFDRCFAGETQQYFHSQIVNGQARIMSCDMLPLRDHENRNLGALVAMNDVTEKVTAFAALELEELEAA